jgi:ornithine decarboxylase
MKDLSIPFAVAADKDEQFLSQLLSYSHVAYHAKSELIHDSKELCHAPYEPLITNARPVAELMNEHMTKILRDEEPDDAFYVADVGEVIRQHDRWKTNLPNVEPFYAIKCNPDPIIIRTLARLGAGFDCASKAEIDAVLAQGVSPARIIYANPCKAVSHIKHAYSKGVNVMTFDNADELYKIKKHHPAAKMVLRILTDDSKSLCKFGVKFGAHPHVTGQLLQVAKDIGLDVVGVSFHVGSGCMDATSFADAIAAARRVFDEAHCLGFKLTLLDIGGGFPGADAGMGITFSEIVSELAPAIAHHFGEFSNLRIIAEPGRYFVNSAYTLAVNVHARRVVDGKKSTQHQEDEEEAQYMYYINEGLYSSLNCIYFDHKEIQPRVLMKAGAWMHGQDTSQLPVYSCSIWGPTCDSMDVITRSSRLPVLEIGDWLYFDAMGAYTVAAASTFNGFRCCTVIWTNSEAHNFII